MPGQARAQVWDWARGCIVHETTAYEGGATSTASVTSGTGEIFEIVTFWGDSVTFGTHTIIPGGVPGAYHGALIKYDSTGGVCWAKYVAQVASMDHINIDVADNVYLTGRFNTPTLTLGTTVCTRVGLTSNYFVAKFDSSGNIIWANNNGGTWDGMDVKTDSQCNLYLGGDFGGTIYYGTDTFVHGTYGNDVLLLKYDSSGVYLWGKAVGAAHSRALSLSLDKYKSIYLSGYYGAPFSFAGDTATMSGPSGYFDNFLLKYDSVGTPQWLRSVPTHDIDRSSTCTDQSGNVYVISTFSSSSALTIGSFSLVPYGASDVYVAKYSGTGTVIWAKRYGGWDRDYGSRILADPAGHLWITGSTRSSVFNVGSSSIACDISTNGSAYIASLDTNGNPIYLNSFRNGGYNLGSTVANDRFGNIYMCGNYMNGNCIIGTDTLVTVTVPSPYYLVGHSFYIARLGNAFIPPCPTITLEGSFFACEGSIASISGSVLGGAWTVSDTSIASIDLISGVVSCVAPGTVTLTYSLSPACFETRMFTVNPLPTVGSIVGLDTVLVSASITLTDSTPGGVWTSNNTGIATVNSTGVVSGIAPGVAVISYTMSDSCGFTYVVKPVTVLQSHSSVLAPESLCKKKRLKVFPNPSSGEVTIFYDFAQEKRQLCSLAIFDISGRKVEELQLDDETGSWVVNTELWANGFFLVRMEGNGKMIEKQKLVIIH